MSKRVGVMIAIGLASPFPRKTSRCAVCAHTYTRTSTSPNQPTPHHMTNRHPGLTPSVPKTNASKNTNNTAYVAAFPFPNRNPGTLNHITTVITSKSQTIHLARYVDAADASREMNGNQFPILNGKKLLIIAIGERNVDGVGATEVDSVVR